jgi:hypothetical protein
MNPGIAYNHLSLCIANALKIGRAKPALPRNAIKVRRGGRFLQPHTLKHSLLAPSYPSVARALFWVARLFQC